MLSQFDRLSQLVDGRYATDDELHVISDYTNSFQLRLETYLKLQAAEVDIVQQVQARLKAIDPALFQNGHQDMTAKWRRDTIRALRYSATAMLVNDPETLKERFLLWFQTIMRAFGTQRTCDVTYKIMQDVVKQHLTSAQANLFCPFLELNRQFLGEG
jgi:hypothetical protein